MMDDGQREKDRDRSRRGDRPSRFSDATRDRSNDRDRADGKRIFVSNIPYEFRWTELKDLFKEKVGDVAYVELFNDENGKPRGNGVVEFTTTEAVKKALFVMHRYELNGRKLVVKEGKNIGDDRVRMGNKNTRTGGGRNNRDEKESWNKPREPEDFNTYGLSLQFLDSINVQPPLVKKVFVANLDYKADRSKIKEVFKMAGKVRNIDLAVDKDGNSRGFAVIEYDHPVEAVQAISMFDKQMLYERRMTVRMDRGVTDKFELRLPEGLKGIGLGLGPNGEPLRDVARNLPQNNNQNNLNIANTGASIGASVLGAVPNSAASVALNGLGTGLGGNTLNTNNALGGSLGLQALGFTGLGALQNQLLQQGLTANDLASVLTAQANVNVNNANTLGLGNSDLGSNVLGNSLTNNLLGNNSMSSGPLSGPNRGQMSNVSMPSQNYSRDSGVQQSNRDKASDMVIVTNLPPTVTWQLIREKFSECGDVKYAEMPSADTAIVKFHTEWDSERAIKMFDRTRIDGRTIDVRFF